jgi:Cd2+/Zn2+-exporting ATPase
MDCPSCAIKIENALKRLSGIDQVSVNVSAGSVTIKPSSSAFSADAAAEAIRRLGYGTEIVTPKLSVVDAQGRATVRFRVDGMDCASCAIKIETALKRVPGVDQVSVNVGSGSVAITPSSSDFSPEHAAAAIRRLGYGVEISVSKLSVSDPAEKSISDGHEKPSDAHSWWQTSKGRLVIIAGALLGSAFVAEAVFPDLAPWPFVLATLVSLLPVGRRAFEAARAGSIFTIEMLMTIAAAGALAINAAEEAAVVVFLFAVGELLEGVAAMRARRSITALSRLAPKTALLIENGTTRQVPADTLIPGQQVLVRPGDRISCDGRIVDGRSNVDEAPITGESMPRAKAPGDEVFAGTINQAAALTIEVTKAAADNTIARIVKLVEEAQEAKAPVERFIDRFARLYMPIVVGIALLVAIVPPLVMGEPWDQWIYRALTLLLIACPCALVISTPAAIAAGLAAGARHGLLIKGGGVLEALGGLKTIAFDKTGTLTQGQPQVTDVLGVDLSSKETLRIAAALETGSNHPLAQSILRHAAECKIDFPVARDIEVIAGEGLTGTVDGRSIFFGSPRGVYSRIGEDKLRSAVTRLESEGKTVSLLLEGSSVLGYIAMRDEPREDAKQGLSMLTQLGIKGVMLTGDNARTAKAIAEELGIEARAELLPQDKARIVAQLDAWGYGPVGKVGDGINDAPALAAAHVGIAMGAGTDVALETADAALLKNKVSGVAELVGLSRATLGNVKTNVALALGSKAVFLVTTVLGITGMWIAVMADTGATVLVTLNALRLLHYRFR